MALKQREYQRRDEFKLRDYWRPNQPRRELHRRGQQHLRLSNERRSGADRARAFGPGTSNHGLRDNRSAMWKEKNLKQFVLMPVLLACALWAQAQGTFQFHATLTGSQVVPPNSDPTVGMGDFWLTGDILSFRVDVPLITFITMSGTINGPALPGENAPVIFDLGGAGVYPGSSQGDPPGYRFFSPFDGTFGAGPFTLTSQQISELQSGLWYVNITSFTMPDGQLRGQILPVPEPSTLALFGVAGAFLVAYRRCRFLGRGCFQRPQSARRD